MIGGANQSMFGDDRQLRRILSDVTVILMMACLIGCQKSPTYETRDEFGKYYDEYHVRGSFVLFDLQKNNYLASRCQDLFGSRRRLS
jgi:hypothetical protein